MIEVFFEQLNYESLVETEAYGVPYPTYKSFQYFIFRFQIFFLISEVNWDYGWV